MQITLTGIDEVEQELQDTLLAGIVSGMEKIGLRGEYLVKREAPKAFGRLASSVFPHLEQDANILTEIITNGPPADVYGTPVNFGSRPHFPPYEELIPWVKKKFGATDEKTARSIAFLIARKISQQGTDPNNFYGRAFEVLSEEAADIMKRQIGEAFEEAGYR